VEIFDDTHGEWFTPDVLDEIERDADMQHEPLRLRLRPC
jgi:anti-sigma factor ChrR (cupin superfamily)